MMVESGLEEEFLFQGWEFLVSSRLYTRGSTLFCWRFAVTFLEWLSEPLKNSPKEYKGICIILHALRCLKTAQNNCSKANESNMSSYSRWCHIFNLLSPKFRNIKEILEMNHHHDTAIWFFFCGLSCTMDAVPSIAAASFSLALASRLFLASFMGNFSTCRQFIPHRIHVWYIYLHLPSKSTRCR